LLRRMGALGLDDRYVPSCSAVKDLASLIHAKYQEIRCPDGMACFETDFSPSKIYCRQTFLPPITCPPSFDVPAVCISGMKSCNATMGGACCPLNATCSLEGCNKKSTENATVTAVKIGEVCGTSTAVSSGAKRIFGCPGWFWLSGFLVWWPVLSILIS
jgi:hypothetical protein